MVKPAVGVTSDRMYRRLPEFYRVADIGQDYALLRLIASVNDQVSDMEEIVNGWYQNATLVDPQHADVTWLPWLAQLVGVELNTATTEQAQRDAIQYASAGWSAGTKQAMMAAAQSALTGTKHVELYTRSVTTAGDGTVWDILLVTSLLETPSVPAVLQAVVDKGAKPAGVVLHHRAYSITWATFEATYPTWNAIEAKGSWQAIENTGL